MTVLEEGSGDDGPSRLQVPGCALSAGWQRIPDEHGTETSVYSCDATLCGDAGAVEFAIAAHALPGGGDVVAALRQPITILSGARPSQPLQGRRMALYEQPRGGPDATTR